MVYLFSLDAMTMMLTMMTHVSQVFRLSQRWSTNSWYKC
jgi:hypothetical protein